MQQDRSAATQNKLIAAATDLIRRKGYVATTIDDVCERAGVTKGAFFHHYDSKEELARACLAQWDSMAAAMDSTAPFNVEKSPRSRVLAYMDFYIGLFNDSNLLKSCLAGTTVQEVADTNPVLRGAANACFVNGSRRFRELLDDACHGAENRVDTRSLADFWIGTIQGALILFKASRDASVIRGNLNHAKAYIAGQLPSSEVKPGTKRTRRRTL